MKYVLCLLMLVSVKVSLAQNLVPNPSFEDYSDCPSDLDQVFKCVDWFSRGGTSDYFNACCSCASPTPPIYSANVPENVVGFQEPASGQGYCGVVCYTNIEEYREYIGCRLKDSLEVGVKYYASIRVSLADTSYWASDKIGMKFRTAMPIIWPTAGYLSNNQASVQPDSIISNDNDWTSVSGSFVADSAYNYLLIGNFFTDSMVSLQVNNPFGFLTSYYYIDDVCVSTDSLTCADFHLSTNHQSVQLTLSIYPTITHQAVNITFPQGSSTFNIFNAIGQSVYNSSVTSLHQTVDVSHFSEGIYFVRVQTHQGVQTAKFVVQH